MVKRRKYDKEFKREAVRLVLEDGRPATEVERNLGTGSNMVSRWVRESQKDPQDKVRRVRPTHLTNLS